VIVVGHRGARFEAPENTTDGFRYALDLGLTALEFDVRLTKDHQVAVIHDATVDRTTDGTGAVADLTMDELRALDARSIHTAWPTPCPVPTLAEAMEIAKGFETFELEIKSDAPERLDLLVPLVLEELGRHEIHSRVVITSFDPYALELVRRHALEQDRGYIGRYDHPEFLETALRLGCTRACIPYATGLPELVAAAQEAGLTVTGWPTNTREEYDEHVRRGVDFLCTDAPGTVLDFLAG
jgi:glycerophosphoryl diester phosphodiesterase